MVLSFAIVYDRRIAEVCFHMIADPFAICDPRSSAIIANRATRLGGLEHSPPSHASHLSEIVSRAAANYKMADKRNVLAASVFFFITRSTKGRFSVSRVLFCTLLIERSRQRQLTLKAALEYNAVLSPLVSPRLAGTNRLHGKK